jgi:hypothetical protein
MKGDSMIVSENILISDYDEQTKGAQQENWQLILHYSELINQQLSHVNWAGVMMLSKQREQLLNTFFEHQLCRELLPEVTCGVELMRRQHEEITEALTELALAKPEVNPGLFNLVDRSRDDLDLYH